MIIIIGNEVTEIDLSALRLPLATARAECPCVSGLQVAEVDAAEREDRMIWKGALIGAGFALYFCGLAIWCGAI